MGNIFNKEEEVSDAFNPEAGAFVFKNTEKDEDDDRCDEIGLFMYFKMTDAELKKALPISYNKNEGNYMVAYFVNRRDFIGQGFNHAIAQEIVKNNMINLLENDYEFIHEKLPELTEESFDNKKKFAQSQIDSANK